MKILFINPPSSFLLDENVFPTLGILYLSSYLKMNGYNDISLIDFNGNHELPEYVDADVVGFYSNTPQFPYVLEILNKIKKVNINKNAKYIIGGPHVSGISSDGEKHFDYVVVGEGERAFLDIVKSIDNNNPILDKVLRYDYIENLDLISFPDRDLMDINNYKYNINGISATTVITSRGCPFSCGFCANNVWGKTLRLRSPENIYSEVKQLKEKYGYRAFMFFDDTMTVHKKRMDKICDLLTDLNITYRCFIRGDTVDKNILTKMKESGCVEVGIGVESGSPRILKIALKGENIEKNRSAIKMCNEVGIRVKGFFIIGLPGEDIESVNETIQFIDSNNIDDFDISIFTPYPGSKIYNNKDAYDIHFTENYSDYWYKGKPGHYKSVVSTSSLTSEEIVNLRDYIEKRFKGRKK